MSDYINPSVSVTDTSQTLTLGSTAAGSGKSSVLVVNDGAGEIFAKVFRTTETPAAVTAASGFRLEPGESLTWQASQTQPYWYEALSLICSAGETATARVLAC